MRKIVVVGIALIAIMFGSSIAFGFIQAFYFSPGQAQQQNQLPTELIINYELPLDQENFLISRGLTIAKYTYSINCGDCIQEKVFLEQLVTSNEFQNQILLQEISADVNQSKLFVLSILGQREIEPIDANKTVEAFCSLVINQPLGCAFQINQ